MVVFNVDSTGKIFPCCQLTDYNCRARELLNYSILEYFTDTYEEDIQYRDVDGDADRKIGRPRNQRASYLDNHPKHRSAQRVIRSKNHNVLPNFIGSYFPRRDVDDIHSFYCTSMLLLLKPWRNIKQDLKSSDQNWSQALDDLIATNPTHYKRILSNIHYFHECESAARADREHAQTIFHEDQDHNMDIDEGLMELREDGDIEMPAITEEDVEYLMSTQTSERDMIHGRHAVELAMQAGVFSRDDHDWMITNHPAHIVSEHDLLLLSNWKEQLKSNVEDQSMDSVQNPSPSHIYDDLPPDVTPLTLEEPQINLRVKDTDDDTSMIGEEAIAPLDVSHLNDDQLRAFNIISQHLDLTLAGRNPPPLRTITYGEGGTGKSQVIQSVTDYFDRRKVTRLLLKSAYTGIAASIVKGKTMHYIGQMSYREIASMGVETRKKLEKIWQYATYLIIDRV